MLSVRGSGWGNCLFRFNLDVPIAVRLAECTTFVCCAGKDGMTGKILPADQLPGCPFPRFNRQDLGLPPGSSAIRRPVSQCPLCASRQPDRLMNVYDLLVHNRSRAHRDVIKATLREEPF